MKKFSSIFFIAVVTALFFNQFFLKGLLPVPSDTIIGLYHPFRDMYSKSYPNGIPFKNFLITDSVRQEYPWRKLSISLEKKFQLPLWNPYSFSGAPLLANFQSAPFYPFNILLFILPMSIGWSLLIFLQPLLGAIFFYLYLDNLKINKYASFLGAISFVLSGFFVAWMEWGTIAHVALWLPLILLSIDKIVLSMKYQVLSIRNREVLIWSFSYVFALTSSFFAGHLQTFFYIFIISLIYLLARWFQYGKNIKTLLLFTIYYLLFTIVTAIQWFPTLQFILLSARDIDQTNWQNLGWFIPWQNLIQFIVPDFFGNPTTLNYWGVWNYGEFVGYIGIFSLLMAFFALFFRHDKKTLFFGTLFFLSLIFSLPTIFAKIPFILHIPFVGTAQPTRLLFITDFSLVVLSAFGFDYLIRNKNRGIIYTLLFFAFIFLGLWLFIFLGKNMHGLITAENILVAKRNLLLPTVLFSIFFILCILIIFSNKQKINSLLYLSLIFLTIFELFRFGLKFNPFTSKEYLFPSTLLIEFLQKQVGQFRIMSTDSRILPPNFSIIYNLQSIEGYDPLYLKRYGELVAASERGEPNILPPFGFNRIITPHNYNSRIIDLLGVKYVLSLSELSSPKLKKVFQEGQTRVYENKNVLPRVFFVEEIKVVDSREEAINTMFREDFDQKGTAVVEKSLGGESISPPRWNIGSVEIVRYGEDNIIVKTKNESDGFLVLTDSFYPIWHAKIDGLETNIYLTDYNFRGIIVPKGGHIAEFYASLL